MSTVESTSQIGRQVRFKFGNSEYEGTIASERKSRAGDSHIFKVEVLADPDNNIMFEVNETEVRYVSDADMKRISSEEIIDFLENGGLVSILRRNSGGTNQPKVWLRLDSRGNVSYTFSEEHGVVGGKTIPFGTLEGDKIFSPRKDAVVEYLQGFKLTQAQADAVVESVGTYP